MTKRTYVIVGSAIALILLVIVSIDFQRRHRHKSEADQANGTERMDVLFPSEDFAYSLGLKFVRISKGAFVMGSPPEEPVPEEFRKLEQPHKVTIKQDYFMSATEVTNYQFLRFILDTGYRGGSQGGKDFLKHLDSPHHSAFAKPNNPVVFVSWYDARAFCEWVSKKTGETFRLPNEEEWEYAARCGKASRYAGTSDDEELLDYAWLKENSLGFTRPVGTRKPNSWGLYDMSGNVWEWVDSILPLELLAEPPVTDEKWMRFRGGFYRSAESSARCSARWAGWAASKRVEGVGFRVVWDVPQGQVEPSNN